MSDIYLSTKTKTKKRRKSRADGVLSFAIFLFICVQNVEKSLKKMFFELKKYLYWMI